MKAVYAGSFDPFTFGHLEIVREASKFFDEVIILCAVNSKKSLFFSRAAMITGIEKCLEREGLRNVQVVSSENLTADVCAEYGADYLVRGLRNTSDYLYEEDIARFNQRLNPSLKTIYFRAADDTVSSTAVKELFQRGKDISQFVPPDIIEALVWLHPAANMRHGEV